MSFEPRIHEVTFGPNRATTTLQLKRNHSEIARQTLTFEVRFTLQGPGSFLVVNPTLAMTVYRAKDQGLWEPQHAIRFPMTPGTPHHTGSVLGKGGMLWHPFSFLPAELIHQVNALVHPTLGLQVELVIGAVLVPLHTEGTVVPPGGVQDITWTERLRWSPSDWQSCLELMAWSGPRGELPDEDAEIAGLFAEAEREFERGHFGEAVGLARRVVERVGPRLEGRVSEDLLPLVGAIRGIGVRAGRGWQRAEVRLVLSCVGALVGFGGR